MARLLTWRGTDFLCLLTVTRHNGATGRRSILWERWEWQVILVLCFGRAIIKTITLGIGIISKATAIMPPLETLWMTATIGHHNVSGSTQMAFVLCAASVVGVNRSQINFYGRQRHYKGPSIQELALIPSQCQPYFRSARRTSQYRGVRVLQFCDVGHAGDPQANLFSQRRIPVVSTKHPSIYTKTSRAMPPERVRMDYRYMGMYAT